MSEPTKFRLRGGNLNFGSTNPSDAQR